MVVICASLAGWMESGRDERNRDDSRCHLRRVSGLRDIDIFESNWRCCRCRRTVVGRRDLSLAAKKSEVRPLPDFKHKEILKENIFIQEKERQNINPLIEHAFLHLYPIVQSKIIYICPPFLNPGVEV